MLKVFAIFRRFLPPYRKYVFWSLIFNVLTAFFSLFSFAAIIPVLNILFGLRKPEIVYQPWSWSDSMAELTEAARNNFSFYLEQLINEAGPGLTLLMIGLFLILMTALKTGTAFLAVKMTIPIRMGVVRDLKNTLYRKIVSLPLGFFTEEKRGDIMSRMTSDVSEVEVSVVGAVDMIFKHPLMILIYLTVMIVMSWQLTVFVLFLLPVSGWLIGIVGRNLRRSSAEAQAQQGELLSQLDETIGGLRVIKAFNAEKKVEQRFAALNERMRKTFSHIHVRYNMAFPLSEFVGTAVIAILLWFGGLLIVSDRSTIDAAGFIYYLIIFKYLCCPFK